MHTGDMKLKWAHSHMDVIREVEREFREQRPFRGLRIGMALHVEAKTGILALVLKEGGAEVHLASCNPLSTQDDVVHALRERGVSVHARRGESREEYYENLRRVLDAEPQVIIDDGGDLTTLLHTDYSHLEVWGGSEETTTGVVRLRVMERKGILRFPMFDVNDAMMKHLFDNRYGTGQSTLDGIMTATNLLIAGKTVVVAGYGWCGRGIAMRMRGMGADVIVTEVDPVKAIEARMDGFRVMRMADAIREADFVVTATGMKGVVRKEHLEVAKDGCVLANAGHFDNEIDREALAGMAASRRTARPGVEEYVMPDGRRIYLLSDGRLVNLAAGQGHPVEIMDMSFSLQALTARYIVERRGELENRVYPVPREIDQWVAVARLRTLGIEIDALTEEQIRYLNEWQEGT
jgi:adenosylhomocysteinase